jgi:glycosyltransferase involved in cell wall biosynthesis
MRIAIIAPPWFEVPPSRYGGIEWVVAMLADGLADRGHEVTLFATGDSTTRATLARTYAHPPSALIGQALPQLHHALCCLDRAGEFDVINDHSGPLAAALACMSATPLCHTVHGPLTGEPGDVYALIDRVGPGAALISLSENQRSARPGLDWLATCHNAIDMDAYPLEEGDDGYLTFLGRMTPEKGAHNAIEVARETGLPLRLAGKVADVHEHAYFEERIRPRLGGDIEYLGEITHDEKVRLLQRARVTLFPIEWSEPFGLVMLESMACGTPILATPHGAVPEVVEDGRGGFVVDSVAAMAAAVDRAAALPAAGVRASVAERFSPGRMVDDYEAAYARLVERARPRRRAS